MLKFAWLVFGYMLLNHASFANVCQLQSQQELALSNCSQLIAHQTDLPTVIQLAMVNKPQWFKAQWVKLNFYNQNQNAVNRLLAFGIPDAFFLTVMTIENQQLKTLFSLDTHTAFNQRPVMNRFLYAKLQLAAQKQHTLYIVYHTHGKTPLQLRLLTPEQLAQQDTKNNLLNGIIFGVLINLVPILFFNQQGFRYAATRSYAALIIFCLLFLGQIEGYNFQFLWPQYPGWNMQAPNVISIGLLLSHALFSIHLLQVQQRFARLFNAFLVIITLAISSLFFLTQPYFTEWTVFLAVVYVIVAISTGILAVRQQVPAARLYVLGGFSLIIFNLILMSLSIFWQNPFPELSIFSYPKMAYLLEPLFFMIAVISQLQRFNEQKAEFRLKRQAETQLLIKAEQERLAAVEEAKHKQLLLASASHDLSQPLASIRFAMQALRAREENDPVAQHIQKTLDYAQSLIEDLIQQARHQVDNQSDRIVLFELFDRLQDEFAAVAEKKGLKLSYVSSNLQLHGSALMLHRILSNLLANAIRYTQKGRVVLGVRRRVNAIEIQVLDTGIGLFASDCQALIAPFQQGQQSDKAGYGLGLFIVKTLCHQCHYELKVSSSLGKGSVFAIKIPLSDVC